ncbi:MAG: hypothetical protein QW186_09500 [Candidatus Bathyarchaeia archaeon]
MSGDSESNVRLVVERVQRLEEENEKLRLELWRLKRKPSRVVGYVLLLLGAISLILSTSFSSLTFAFIGLGLTFWGALLLYIRPVRYVKQILLDSTVISTLTAIDRVLTELKYEGKAVYLPPRYLREVRGGTVFIPFEGATVVPPVEEVSEERVFLRNPNGICLTPPGLGLVNMYEEELGVVFARVDLNYLVNNLPRLFVEGLEAAEDLEFDVENGVVRVKLAGSVYVSLCREAVNLSKVCSSIGCPLCSSIACALARASGKPVVIEKCVLSEDGRTIEACYRILEE